MRPFQKYILGLSLSLGLQSCSKDPMGRVVDGLAETCLAVEATNVPCGYRRGDSPEIARGICLTYSGMETADKKLQERTSCRLLIFQRTENNALDYLVQRKNCDLVTAHPDSDLFKDYKKIYPHD